jgi:hypothetical protein
VYANDQLLDVLRAVNSYQSVANKDPYANLMVQAAITNASTGVLLNLVYLKPEASPAAFEPFYGIPTLEDTTAIQPFINFSSKAVMPDIPRYLPPFFILGAVQKD